MSLRTQMNLILVLLGVGLMLRGYVQYRIVVRLSDRYELALEQSSQSLVKLNEIQATTDHLLNEAMSTALLETLIPDHAAGDSEVVAASEEEGEELLELNEDLTILIASYQTMTVEPTLISSFEQAAADLNRYTQELLVVAAAETVSQAELFAVSEALEHQEETMRELVAEAIHLELLQSERSKTEAEQTAQAILNSLIFVLIFSLVVPLGANWLVNRLLFKPINRLQAAATTLQSGSWQIDLPVQGQNEFATLAQTFNQMATNLQDRDQKLRDLNFSLEGQVAQRTGELEEKIQQLNQTMRFRDEFLAVMSHELRTPMNAILGYSSFALLKDNLEDDLKKMLERIVVNSESLLSLINSILDISRINSGRVQLAIEPFNLRQMMQGLADDFQRRAQEKGLTFIFQMEVTVPMIADGDSERLAQVVNNLLVNAIKFTDQGQVRFSVDYQTEQLQIKVQDTGIGIPETWQTLIFEEFRQVDMSSKRTHQGAGLGLSVVQKLAQLMGGQVRVESVVGEGSTFYVQIPLKATENEEK